MVMTNRRCTMNKKPPPIFEVSFDGNGIYPEKIPFGVLARALAAIQRLASGLEMEDEETTKNGPSEDETNEIQLLSVKRGSAVYKFGGHSPELALKRFNVVGTVLSHPESIGENDYVLGPLERISAAAKSLKCSVVVREPGRNGAVLARIEPESYEHVARSVFVEGGTSITGEVTRVGGATEVRCALRVPFQSKLLYCKVQNAEVARNLGDSLYKRVTVHGKATWVRGTWRLRSFVVFDMNELQQDTILDAFQSLYDAGGSGWDGIEDPQQHIHEVFGK
jgi:hypothetical protein